MYPLESTGPSALPPPSTTPQAVQASCFVDGMGFSEGCIMGPCIQMYTE